MKKITIFYADDLVDASDAYIKNIRDYQSLVEEQDYIALKVSDRIDWVKYKIESALNKSGNAAVITNDYSLIKLIELLVPKDQLVIYNADSNKFFSQFCELEPNPTLDIFDYLYRESIKAMFLDNSEIEVE